MNYKFLLFTVLFLFCSTSSAIQIAFFKTYDSKGNLIEYEGDYSHTAVSYKGKWLHAHPYLGVTLSSNLYEIGSDFIILESKHIPDPTDNFVKEQLKMKFNVFAKWTSLIETYCGKQTLLSFIEHTTLRPSSMEFKSDAWHSKSFSKGNIKSLALPIGELGISPTDIFNHVLNKMNFKILFRSVPKAKPLSCKSIL